MSRPVAFETTIAVRDACLCLHLQRAARAIGRRFDEAFRPVGLTNGQFSLLMALNVPEPPSMGAVARLLGMDRTTLTAALKPLAARALVTHCPDAADQRRRRLALTEAGQKALAAAVPIWQETHETLLHGVCGIDPDLLRAALRSISALG